MSSLNQGRRKRGPLIKKTCSAGVALQYAPADALFPWHAKRWREKLPQKQRPQTRSLLLYELHEAYLRTHFPTNLTQVFVVEQSTRGDDHQQFSAATVARAGTEQTA